MLIEEVAGRPPLLIIVHPGSCCGSVDHNLGKYAGRAYREGVVNDIEGWNGAILIVDSEASEECENSWYGNIGRAMTNAIHRAETQGFPAARVFGDDDLTPNWVGKVTQAVRDMGFNAADRIVITGAWVGTEEGFGEDSGCVTAVFNALQQSQYMKVSISDNAIPDVDEYDRDD